MRKNVNYFINQRVLDGISQPILKQFFSQFPETEGLKLSELSSKELFEALLENYEFLSDKLIYNLLMISDLASEEGFETLMEVSNDLKSPIRAIYLAQEQKQPTRAEIAMVAYLQYHEVFEVCVDRLQLQIAQFSGEYNGNKTISIIPDPEKVTLYESALKSFYNGRLQGAFCKVRQYQDANGFHFLILHGKAKNSVQVVEKNDVNSKILREAKLDYLCFQPEQAKILVNARTAKEKKTLATLFAHHIVNDEWLDKKSLELNYTLDPIIEQGFDFEFNYQWDRDCRGVKVTEIVFSDGKRGSVSATFRFFDLLKYLQASHPDFDPKKLAIRSVTLRFSFYWQGKEKKKDVTIKPPSSAKFDRRYLQNRIMEHLKRNHFVFEHSH